MRASGRVLLSARMHQSHDACARGHGRAIGSDDEPNRRFQSSVVSEQRDRASQQWDMHTSACAAPQTYGRRSE